MATVIIRIEDTADGGIHILCDAEGDTQAAVEAEKTKE